MAAAMLLTAACSKDYEIVEPQDATRGELRVTASTEAPTRVVVGDRDEAGNWQFNYSEGDAMVLWEVAGVTSRGYNYVRLHQPTSATLSSDLKTGTFNYSIPSPYEVGATYPGASSYTTESVYYTGILPTTAFAGFYQNYPAGVSSAITEASEGFIRLNVPREQNPTATSPDPSAIILRAYDFEYPTSGVVQTKFKHVLAYMKITVKGLPVGCQPDRLFIGGDSRITFANDLNATDKYCKYDLEDGFASTSRGANLIVNMTQLEPNEDGNYVVWAACKPYTYASAVATPSFGLYEVGSGIPVGSPIVPVSVDGSQGIKLVAGEVSSFTLNFGYGNDLTQPKVTATTASVDAESSTVTFAWGAVGEAVSYNYTVDGGEQQTTTDTSVTLTVKPNTEVSFAVQAVPAEDSGYVASGWGTAKITSSPYLVALVMSEIDEGDVNSYSATLEWTAVENAVGYSYKIGENGTETNIGNVLTYTFKGLSEKSYYSIFLRAKAESGSTSYSDSEWVEKLVLTSEKSPLTMSAVTVSDVTDRSAVVSWTAVDGAASYRYKLSDGTEGTLASGGTLTGLTAETAYTIQVMAVAQTESDWSDSAWGEAVSFTTTEAVGPLNLWGSDEFAAWSTAINSTTMVDGSSYAGLNYTLGGTTNTFKFVTADGVTYLESTGNGDKGKNYLWFTVTGKGTITVKGYNGYSGTKDVHIYVGTTDEGVDVASGAEFTHTATFDVQEETVVKVWVREKLFRIYSIAWTPTE